MPTVKKTSIFCLAVFACFCLAGCGTTAKPATSDNAGKAKPANQTDAISKVCDYFPKELVEAAIGKPIVKTQVPITGDDSCDYYTSYSETYDHTPYGDKPGGPKVVVVYDTKDFAEDRVTNEKFGSKYEKDPSIGMDNFVMRNNVKKIWQTALVLGDEKYIRIKFIDDAVTGDDLVKIAQKFAEKITGDKSINLDDSTTTENSEKSEPSSATEQATAQSQQAVAQNFFGNLAALKIQDALALMDADSNTKQAWGVNFNTIKSLKVNKIEEAFKEEWTPNRQSFKVELGVQIKPEGEQFGWRNGANYRWITLEKNQSGQWMVHELANNP